MFHTGSELAIFPKRPRKIFVFIKWQTTDTFMKITSCNTASRRCNSKCQNWNKDLDQDFNSFLGRKRENIRHKKSKHIAIDWLYFLEFTSKISRACASKFSFSKNSRGPKYYYYSVKIGMKIYFTLKNKHKK